MKNRLWCNNGVCSECTKRCWLDMVIPCSPDCPNLTDNGKIQLSACVKERCDAVWSAMLEPDTMTPEEILERYGELPDLPSFPDYLPVRQEC